MVADGVVDAPGFAEGDVVGEADHRPAERLYLDLAVMVAQDRFIRPMNSAVDLDDQPQLDAGQVREVRPDLVLATDLEAVDRPAAKTGPEASFGETGRLAEIAGAGHFSRYFPSPGGWRGIVYDPPTGGSRSETDEELAVQSA